MILIIRSVYAVTALDEVSYRIEVPVPLCHAVRTGTESAVNMACPKIY